MSGDAPSGMGDVAADYDAPAVPSTPEAPPSIGDGGRVPNAQPIETKSIGRGDSSRSNAATDGPRIGIDNSVMTPGEQAIKSSSLGERESILLDEIGETMPAEAPSPALLTAEKGGADSAQALATLSEASQQGDALVASARGIQDVPFRLDGVEGTDDQGNTEARAWLEMWQREGQQMRPLIEYLNQHRTEQLDPARWQQLSLGERMRFLQEVHEKIARQYGFNPAFVVLSSNEAMMGIPGDFNPYLGYNNAGNIFFGRIRVNEQGLSNPFKAVNTIFHESRHAFQWAAIQNPSIVRGELRQQVPAWGQNFANPISQKEDYINYEEQAIERDARAFAGAARILYDSTYRNHLTEENAYIAARIQWEYKQGRP